MTIQVSHHPAPDSSALTSLISSTTFDSSSHPLSATTTQTLHNLQHQHLWTSLQIHNLSLPPSSGSRPSDPAFLVSGLPPTRTYTHPDEQLYMLERGLREADIEPERMFVIPTVQGQSWSLRRMAAVFDLIPEPEDVHGLVDTDDNATDKTAKLAEYYDYRNKARASKEWGGKKLLLAMVNKGMGGDGTVVYYVVQEGAVKPRQN